MTARFETFTVLINRISRNIRKKMLKYIEDSKHIWEGNLEEIRYETVGSVIGTHAGPWSGSRCFLQKLKQSGF